MQASKILHYYNYLTTRDELAGPAYYFHNHRTLEILYCHEGSGHVILDDRFYAVAPRTLMIFKPYQLHLIRMEVPPKYICSLMKLNPFYLDSCSSLFPGCHKLISDYLNEPTQQIFQLDESQHDQLDERMRNLHELINKGARHLHDEAAFIYVLHFFLNLVTHIVPNAAAGKLVKPLQATERVSAVLRRVNERFKEKLTLDMLAEEMHFSANYLSKLFHQHTGRTIPEYITEKRLEHARMLLSTQSSSVEEISQQAGFNSSSYFVRTFKKRYGVPPHQYRLNVSKMYTETQK